MARTPPALTTESPEELAASPSAEAPPAETAPTWAGLPNYECGQPGCVYASLDEATTTTHRAVVHGV